MVASEALHGESNNIPFLEHLVNRFSTLICIYILISIYFSNPNANNIVFAADVEQLGNSSSWTGALESISGSSSSWTGALESISGSSSSWTGALESISGSSSSWTSILEGGEVSAAQVLDNFRAQNGHVEAELFSRIQTLENRLIERLPPQLNHGEYAALVQAHLEQALNIRNYQSTLSTEVFELTILEFKATLQDQLFNLLLSEPEDRLVQILRESPFPEGAIRREALEYVELRMDSLHLNLETARSPFLKASLEQILRYWIRLLQERGRGSQFYQFFLEHFRGKD